jgi:flagellar hook assembly protein FlgD
LYDSFPEASFNTEFKNEFYSKEIQEGDSVRVAVGLTNLTNIFTDSITISYKITKQDRNLIIGKLKTLSPLAGNQNANLNFKLPTVGFVGNNILQLNLNPLKGEDQLEFNNFITYNYLVNKDLKEPLVDVAFDGKHIINGETVSPNPNINIFILDDNKYLLLKDTNAIKVYLKFEENGIFKRVSFNSGKLLLENSPSETNNKATYIFRPGLLADGKYSLKITSEDATGNSTKSDYLVEFDITNQQTITNFLPYPNPVTTSTRFVFKLTGLKIPDDIKIQIFNQSGKIVKEILKQELGNISIGNNITDYAWDGTDTFGDRLANGIYFYKVVIKNNDQTSYKTSFNSTDKMFKNNMGKIYLLK